MRLCINKEELSCLIDHFISGKAIGIADLEEMLNLAINYSFPIRSLSYPLSKLVEERIDEGSDPNQIIKEFYSFENKFYFQYDELSYEFVCFIIKNPREQSLTLEENLNNLFDKYSDHNYVSTIRY